MKSSSPVWLVDISNTFTKCAAARGSRIGPVRRYPTREWTRKRWLRAWRRDGAPPRIVAACVVPSAGRLLAAARPDVHFLSHRSPLGIGLHYPKPRTLGADRLANAVAAAHLHGAPVIAADFGTAATFDVVDARGRYIGGVIAPGLATLAGALHQATALLPLVRARMPRRALGRSTAAAIQTGVAIGFAGLASAILDALRSEIHIPASPRPRVIATGGDARFARRHVPGIDAIEPRLTLLGLAIVAQRLSPAPRSRARSHKRTWHAASPT